MVIIFCLLAVTLNAFKEFKNIRIKELTKHVDITSRYVQSTTDINILNEGIVPLNKFYHSVHNSISNKLYQISLTQGDITIVPKIIEQNDTKSNSTIYEFQIP